MKHFTLCCSLLVSHKGLGQAGRTVSPGGYKGGDICLKI